MDAEVIPEPRGADVIPLDFDNQRHYSGTVLLRDVEFLYDPARFGRPFVVGEIIEESEHRLYPTSNHWRRAIQKSVSYVDENHLALDRAEIAYIVADTVYFI